MAEKTNDDSVTFVVAFDIGTRTTGYALSHNKEPQLICANPFVGSHVVAGAPTSVLVNDQKQFEAFGVEAEDMYANLDKEKKDKGWALFRSQTKVLGEDGLHSRLPGSRRCPNSTNNFYILESSPIT